MSDTRDAHSYGHGDPTWVFGAKERGGAPSSYEPRYKGGEKVGRFTILRFHARGGMGEVYEAVQDNPKRNVALKILLASSVGDPRRKERFLREMTLSGQLEHPNAVSFFDAGEDRGVPYLAMAFVDGESLETRVNRLGPMAESEALRSVAHVARALDHAWRTQRLLHRDVKPANILRERNEGTILLTDFGLSTIRRSSSELTVQNLLMGSPPFMSPEQANDPSGLDQRSDIYSLGCTLYFLLTGLPPFTGSTSEVLRAQRSSPFPDPREVNPQLGEASWRLLQGMTTKDRTARYRDWNLFLDDLHEVRRGRHPTRWPNKRHRQWLQRLFKGR